METDSRAGCVSQKGNYEFIIKYLLCFAINNGSLLTIISDSNKLLLLIEKRALSYVFLCISLKR